MKKILVLEMHLDAKSLSVEEYMPRIELLEK